MLNRINNTTKKKKADLAQRVWKGTERDFVGMKIMFYLAHHDGVNNAIYEPEEVMGLDVEGGIHSSSEGELHHQSGERGQVLSSVIQREIDEKSPGPTRKQNECLD